MRSDILKLPATWILITWNTVSQGNVSPEVPPVSGALIAPVHQTAVVLHVISVAVLCVQTVFASAVAVTVYPVAKRRKIN